MSILSWGTFHCHVWLPGDMYDLLPDLWVPNRDRFTRLEPSV